MAKFTDLTVEEKERLIEDLRKEIVQVVEKRNNESLNRETNPATDRRSFSSSQLIDRCIR